MNKILFFIFAWITIFCASAFAGELFDDFVLNQPAEDVWWVKTTGKATAEIKSGELTLSSFDVRDSIFLFYKEPIPSGEPITMEVRINLKTNRDDGWLGFFRDFPGDSHVNTLINPLKDNATMFFVRGGGGAVQPRGEDGQNAGDLPVKADEFHTFKIEVTDKEYRMIIDEKEVLRGKRNDASYIKRIFYITPDGFDSHYGPAIYIVDWVRLSGTTIPQRTIGAGVDMLDKLPVTWGRMKE